MNPKLRKHTKLKYGMSCLVLVLCGLLVWDRNRARSYDFYVQHWWLYAPLDRSGYLDAVNTMFSPPPDLMWRGTDTLTNYPALHALVTSGKKRLFRDLAAHSNGSFMPDVLVAHVLSLNPEARDAGLVLRMVHCPFVLMNSCGDAGTSYKTFASIAASLEKMTGIPPPPIHDQDAQLDWDCQTRRWILEHGFTPPLPLRDVLYARGFVFKSPPCDI